MSSSNWNDDEDFTEEQLLAIDAIEASYNLSNSSSSSSSATSIVRATISGLGHEVDPYQTPNIRRQLPRSITSPTASKRFPLSRCKAESRNFPAMRFGGRIFYSKTASEVDNRAMQLLKVLETKRNDSGKAILGFDIEWKPSFKKGVLPRKVATVQICVDDNYCDVMHIFHSGIPQSLQYLIEDSTLVKVGIGIDGDSVKLFHDYGVSIKDVEDLSDLANTKLGGDSKRWGLASLTETLVCKKLLKPNKIRLGNWEVHPLSKEQLQYAATDAYVSWHLYQILNDLPDAVNCSRREGGKLKEPQEVDVKKAMSREEQQVSGRSGNLNSSRSSGSDAFNKTKKIFVGGLPPTLTDEEFRQYFEVYGPVSDVVIMHDQATNRPRGFGFVSFDTEDEVDRVLHKTFHDLSGKQVEVKRALPKDANPGGAGRSMGGGGFGGFQGYGGNESSYEGRVDSNRFMQPQNVGNGLPSYGSAGYGAGYGNGSNGAGYGSYGGYTGSAGGYGTGATGAYGASGIPGAGYGSSTGVAPRNSWDTSAPSGYGNPGYGSGAAHSGYGVPGAAPAQSPSGYTNQAYGYGGYSGRDSGYGNQAAYGVVGGRPSGGASNNPGNGGYMGGGYGDGSWRSDPSQGYGGGYNDGQGRQGQ